MNQLRNKSELNLSAAQLLIENDIYASSVHCSYYASLQLLLSKLIDVHGDSEDFKSKMSQAKQGSHTFYISEFANLIGTKLNLNEKREFRNDLKLLKLFRNESDYENIVVPYDKSISALNLSKKIITRIKRVA